MENRLERKYVLNNNIKTSDFIKLLKNNFKEVYISRLVHSVYFDTPDLSSFTDNIEGIESRFKVRIRWYDNDFKSAKLEIKLKDNLVGKKIIYDLNDFNDSVNLYKYINNIRKYCNIDNVYLPYVINTIPVSYNNYNRKYFESFDSKVRITLDYNLKFKKLYNYFLPNIKSMLLIDYSILELKYKSQEEDVVNSMLKDSLLNLRKFSKYTAGVLAN